MPVRQTVEVPVRGMDCAECALRVQRAIAALPGVESVDVRLSSEKAVIRLEPARVDLQAIRGAVEGAGYTVSASGTAAGGPRSLGDFQRPILTVLGMVFGAVLLVVVAGEWLGLFRAITRRVPPTVGLAAVVLTGYPVFLKVIRATANRQVIAHTLMTVGVLAALAIGEWTTAAIVAFFMRVGDYTERFTTERARRAVKDLTLLAPQKARVERDGRECEVPLAEVRVGDVVVVRPGEKIPVDGEVIAGHATVDQAAVTGESLPAEAGPGARVFAATMARLGSLRVRATHVGPDTTFGRVVRMVEEAEAHRAEVQRAADRFSAYYLPAVGSIAALTFLIRRDPLATAAVLVVACSCSFALATPIAMLASVGAAARRGLLIKGGKYLESLARADILLIDKTGTLTLGRPQITDVLPLDGTTEDAVLALAASAERYSEHPLAEAVRTAARGRGLALHEPAQFEAVPGLGVRARVNGHTVTVGSSRMVPGVSTHPALGGLETQGKTVLCVACDGAPVGLLAVADTLREEVPAALAAVRALGIRHIEVLTGDNERTAAVVAGTLGVRYRAGLLPEEKIAVVKEFQRKGHGVVMVGDGVNDAPALAQADVGIAMGVRGSDVAMEAGHVALMREDWMLVPEVFRIARRTMAVVKMNIAFTTVFNLAGLSLAALGFLPPVFAAAAQSLPDIGILANSSRLLRQR
ncbi:MAG: cation-translocating P-type ATPase [Armatimonadetes bacterium]|nr:cation-translocating P-type ATPase [Armatimonadota bacterium]